MLTHPTHERLITLGLTGMAKAFEEQRRSPDLDALPFEERIGLAGRSRSRRARHQTSHDPPQVRRAAPERMRGRRRFAHATRHRPQPSSPNSSAATGSTATRTCSSQGQPGSAKAGLPAPSATKPAATIVRSSITASRACSRRSPWLAATADMADCSKPSAAFNS